MHYKVLLWFIVSALLSFLSSTSYGQKGLKDLIDHTVDAKQGKQDEIKKKEREDVIGRRYAVPFGMPERAVDRRPRSWIIHQHHSGNGHSTEDV